MKSHKVSKGLQLVEVEFAAGAASQVLTCTEHLANSVKVAELALCSANEISSTHTLMGVVDDSNLLSLNHPALCYLVNSNIYSNKINISRLLIAIPH